MAAADPPSAAAVALPLEGHDLQLNVALVTGVTNAKSVRASLVRGDLEPECALLAARLVAPSLLPLHLAAHRAATLAARGALKARTAHAELVHGLSGSKHIGESLRRFGIADDTTDVLVALFGPRGADATAALAPAVALLERGGPTPSSEGAAAADAAAAPSTLQERLARLFDAPLAARYYHVVPAELRVGGMDEAIACRVGGMECL